MFPWSAGLACRAEEDLADREFLLGIGRAGPAGAGHAPALRAVVAIAVISVNEVVRRVLTDAVARAPDGLNRAGIAGDLMHFGVFETGHGGIDCRYPQVMA